MHRQIGNAVPLQVAHALGRQLRKSMFQKWKTHRQEAIVIIDDDDDDDGDNRNREPEAPLRQVHESDQDDDDDMDIYE
jgi:DNA (cytosine-5)-methyltransferase 1